MNDQVGTPLEYDIDDDPSRLDIDAIHAYLTTSYWSTGVPRDVIDRAVKHSYCVGAYIGVPGGAQVGLVRIVTDYATFAYFCDVYVLEVHRGQGLAKRMVAHAMARPDIGGVRRLMLVTRDAHGLYAPFGFHTPEVPDRIMEIRRLDAYIKADGG